MAQWLVKTEPSTYSIDDLAREKTAKWDGVKNNTALIHLRAMKRGDEVLVFHTGTERAIVGLARVAKPAYPDPKEKDPRFVMVELTFVAKWKKPVTLAVLKGEKGLAGWELLRIGRLSVVPVDEGQRRIVDGLR